MIPALLCIFSACLGGLVSWGFMRDELAQERKRSMQWQKAWSLANDRSNEYRKQAEHAQASAFRAISLAVRGVGNAAVAQLDRIAADVVVTKKDNN